MFQTSCRFRYGERKRFALRESRFCAGAMLTHDGEKRRFHVSSALVDRRWLSFLGFFSTVWEVNTPFIPSYSNLWSEFGRTNAFQISSETCQFTLKFVILMPKSLFFYSFFVVVLAAPSGVITGGEWTREKCKYLCHEEFRKFCQIPSWCEIPVFYVCDLLFGYVIRR